jgi:hypothetical protein
VGAKEKAKRLKLPTAKEPVLGLGAAEPLPSILDKSLVFDPNVSWAIVLRRCVAFLLEAQRKQAAAGMEALVTHEAHAPWFYDDTGEPVCATSRLAEAQRPMPRRVPPIRIFRMCNSHRGTQSRRHYLTVHLVHQRARAKLGRRAAWSESS